MKILVMGISGMLGSMLFRILSESTDYDVYGSLRRQNVTFDQNNEKIFKGIDVLDNNLVEGLIKKLKPDVLINCIGIIKQVDYSNDPLSVIPINSLLPHFLYKICDSLNIRLIHISTDCVFSGNRGNYVESDNPDPSDLYGKSKLLGEINKPNALTIRTSIIGHEINTKLALLEWFLSQDSDVFGYTNAYYSGFTTLELSKIIKKNILPRSDISGLYHLAGHKISKYNLLKVIASVYGKKINIAEHSSLFIDRSLNAHAFNKVSGYSPPDWPELIEDMYEFNSKK
jgi:dTDP-4-dehydrorhamnose reductase